MNQIKIQKILTLLFSLMLFSCISDRLPPEPVEITRPEFMKFAPIGENGLNVPLNGEIKMYFNEKMDLSTFPENIEVKSVSGKIDGSYNYAPESDTVVIYTPSTNYQPAEYYEVVLTGAVRDVNGNSMISPNEEADPVNTWYFTSGQYSENGFPYVFIRDKSKKNMIYRVGNLNEYIDSLIIPGDEDYQTSALEIASSNDNLYVANLKIIDGTLTQIDPSSFSINNSIGVGFGPTNLAIEEGKAYVTNTSGKSFSVVDIGSNNSETYEFADGFRPKDVVYSPLTNKLYFYHTSSKDFKIVDAANYDNEVVLTDLFDNKIIDMEVTNDGRYIYLIESNSSVVYVFDTQSEAITNTIDLGLQYLTDGAMGSDAFYIAYYKGSGGENIGGILKIDLNSQLISAELDWEKNVDQMKLTSAEELIYAVTPTDSTIQVIETKTMKNITEAKVKGSLKYLAITNNNY